MRKPIWNNWQLSIPCDGATDGLAKAIVMMQEHRDKLNSDSEVNFHREWLEVHDNRVTVHVDVVPMGHMENFEVTYSVGTVDDLQ